MAQAPIMPVFTDALIGDTTHLSTEQFGAYVLILLATWRNNGQALRLNEKGFANLTRVSLYKWKTQLRPVLEKFFDISDGSWHQKRLEEEWDRVMEILAKRRASAKAGGLANGSRYGGAKRGSTSEAIHTHNHKESFNSDFRKEREAFLAKFPNVIRASD